MLKNPEALSKYGEQAKDGAIIITTKSAKAVDQAASDAAVKKAGISSVRIDGSDGKSIVYVVDGREVDTIEGLDPERIASIAVLKGPAATSEYGDRAKDGAIVITTRSAEAVDCAASDAAESVDRAASGDLYRDGRCGLPVAIR